MKKPNYAFRVDLPNGTIAHKLSLVQQVFVVATRVRHQWRVVSWCQTKSTAAKMRMYHYEQLQRLVVESGALKPTDVEARLLPCIAIELPEIKQANITWCGTRMRTSYVPAWGESRPTHAVVGLVPGTWTAVMWATSRLAAEHALDAARQQYNKVEIVDVGPAAAR